MLIYALTFHCRMSLCILIHCFAFGYFYCMVRFVYWSEIWGCGVDDCTPRILGWPKLLTDRYI